MAVSHYHFTIDRIFSKNRKIEMNTDKYFQCKTMELASSANEFSFEFWQRAQNKYRAEKLVITMTPNQAKSLLVMLDKAVMKYEEAFGLLSVPIGHVDKTAKLEQVIEQLIEYLNLKEDWDGYGGVVPSEKTVNEAIQFVKTLPEIMPLPEPMIAGSGAIGLYWDEKGIYAEIGFEGDGTFWCYAENAQRDEAGQDSILIGEPLPDDFLNLLEPIIKGSSNGLHNNRDFA
jgi:hypothetical protein